MMLSNAFAVSPPSRSERARLRLLEAALEIFGEKGLDGATVREIAKAAGQNVAAIAYYFGNKEKLYHAVMHGIVRELRHRLRDVASEVEQLKRQATPSKGDAVRLLKVFLGDIYLRLLSRKEATQIIRLVVREQLGPTAGFEILYTEGFRHLHEALCFLVGTALERDWRDRETILRTHMLMGQVYFFAMSREAILRRLGWKSLEGRNAQLVVDLLNEHLETLLSGLSNAPAPSPIPPALAETGVPADADGPASPPHHPELRSRK